MKITLFKLLLALLIVPIIGFANHEPLKGKYTKGKKISKQYNVNANTQLLVNNSYGNIDVTSWDQNRIEIDVFIKTNGDNEEKVQQTLDGIQIEFSSSAGKVSAKTIFEKNSSSSSWWNIFSSNSHVKREVNYVIKMPVKNGVDLNNDYGNISINRLEGDAKISCDYGKLIIGELMGENNILNFDYTKNSTISYIKRARINADYSGFEIEEAGAIDLNADYTSSKINKVTSLNFNCDYGSINIGKVRRLKGNGDYLSTKIGDVYGLLELNLDYGSANIARLTSKTELVKIDSDYTSLKIGYDADLEFSFTVKTSYASIKGMDGLNVSKDEKNSSKNYTGYNKMSNSGNKILINSSYGSVSFYRK